MILNLDIEEIYEGKTMYIVRIYVTHRIGIRLIMY